MKVEAAPEADIYGPKGLPIVGVGLKLSASWLLEVQKEYGDTFRLNIPVAGGGIMFTHPDDVHMILLKDDLFRKPSFSKNPKSFLTRLLGNGLFGATGDDWVQQRKLMQPIFHRQHVQGFFEMIKIRILHYFEWLDAQQGRPIDLHKAMIHVKSDIIAQIILSSSLPEEKRPHIHSAIQTVITSIRGVFDPPLSPILRYRFNHALSLLDDFIYSTIAERQALDIHDRPQDLLTMLLEAYDEETASRMDARQIRDEIFTMFLAGHETTASSLTWAFYEITRLPEIKKTLLNQIDSTLHGNQPTVEDLPALDYARMIFDETLRLYPVAWFLVRKTTQTVPIGDFLLPERKTVFLSPYVTHRHPDFWEEPETFIPERFAKKDSYSQAYFPFGGGKRICIGTHFATLEAQLMLIMFMQRYQLEVLSNHSLKFRPGLVLVPHKPVMVKVSKR